MDLVPYSRTSLQFSHLLRYISGFWLVDIDQSEAYNISYQVREYDQHDQG